MLQADLVWGVFTFIPRLTFSIVLFTICLYHGGSSPLPIHCEGNLLVTGGSDFLYSHFLVCLYVVSPSDCVFPSYHS